MAELLVALLSRYCSREIFSIGLCSGTYKGLFLAPLNAAQRKIPSQVQLESIFENFPLPCITYRRHQWHPTYQHLAHYVRYRTLVKGSTEKIKETLRV